MVIWGEEKLLLHERFILLRTKLTAVSALLKIPGMKIAQFSWKYYKKIYRNKQRNESYNTEGVFSIVLSLLVFRNNLLTVRYSKKGEGSILIVKSKTEDSEQRGV
jgi:hypothetical protein